MENKSNKFLVIVMILTVLFTISGATLAYWNWYSSNEEITNIVFTIGKNFSCAADGGGNITEANASLVPTTCTDDEWSALYPNNPRVIRRTVTVIPTIDKDDLTINMDLWLNVNSLGAGLSKSLNFKYALTTNSNSCTEGVISTGNFNGLTTGDKVKLLDQSYSSSEPQTYYLYIWLDKLETSNESQDNEFNLSLGGECDDKVYNDLMFNVTTVDGNTNSTAVSGFYTLSGFTCENGSIPIYDTNNKTITLNTVDKCDLQFTSVEKRLYDVVEIGDYVEYFGDNGCTGQQCNGWNVNQTDTDLYENYGGCSNDTQYRFTTYGWRVLYKENNSVYIVSAGAPECITSTKNNNTQTINDLNSASLKYCNELYQSNGECNYDTAHAFNDSDFYQFTRQHYGIINGRHLSSGYGDQYCYVGYATKYCGLNNDIVDNGGNYFFGSKHSPTNTEDTLIWFATLHQVESNLGNTTTAGLRPVLKLDASILTTGGKGTKDKPYTISERAGL